MSLLGAGVASIQRDNAIMKFSSAASENTDFKLDIILIIGEHIIKGTLVHPDKYYESLEDEEDVKAVIDSVARDDSNYFHLLNARCFYNNDTFGALRVNSTTITALAFPHKSSNTISTGRYKL
ncbi:hypothetical protein Pse7367_2549 [Thalassoporum mexicanum PCC 7367]|uniref:hypothetical protein n=1 Tax=Thalassoporum mexicanum TaxID=3457544 RepID=UPI00029FAAC0|nr:hypothetical protein [Pseudanabaena sp. PCC 7367]AFY70808.1 hypothetical protein Pse7367_2549 [Pseudanabaena sp. PCC 7367]